MDTPQPTMQAFFEAFETSSEGGDAASLAKLYAEAFLVARPNGVQVIKASDLEHIIPKRKQMLDAAGCGSAKLVSLSETRLDNQYSMVRTEWRWRVNRGDGEYPEITLPSTYIVRRSDEGLQIVFYLAHGDITAVLRERGLL
jgi:ketosteroid isomerase-like protein